MRLFFGFFSFGIESYIAMLLILHSHTCAEKVIILSIHNVLHSYSKFASWSAKVESFIDVNSQHFSDSHPVAFIRFLTHPLNFEFSAFFSLKRHGLIFSKVQNISDFMCIKKTHQAIEKLDEIRVFIWQQ